MYLLTVLQSVILLLVKVRSGRWFTRQCLDNGLARLFVQITRNGSICFFTRSLLTVHRSRLVRTIIIYLEESWVSRLDWKTDILKKSPCRRARGRQETEIPNRFLKWGRNLLFRCFRSPFRRTKIRFSCNWNRWNLKCPRVE